MKYATINGKAVAPPPARQVISRSAILILSGVLIGTTLSQGHLTGVAFCGFCAGIIGMLAFYALDRAAQGRRERVVRRKLAVVDSTLTNRLQKHVAPEHRFVARRRPHPTAEASYLPVAVGCRS